MKVNINTAPKKHIVFDFDDTLADTKDFNQNMFIETFKKVNQNISNKTEMFLRKLHSESVGTPMSEQFEKAISKLKVKKSVDEMVKLNENLHLNNSSNIKIFKGTEDFLKNLIESGKKVSICTNRQTSSLTNILKKNKLKKYFTNIISCSDLKHEKPDPYCLQILIGTNNTEEFIYFGDSETDSKFAKNAGVDYVIVDQYLHRKRFFELISSTFNI